MKVAVLNESKQSIGGGWTFIGNLARAGERMGLFQCVGVNEANVEVDVALIPSSSMVTKETVRAYKDRGIPIVLRVDNMPRNSRNRNTGSSRLKMFADMADVVVYQSQWARNFLDGFIQAKKYNIINNGIDTDIFSRNGPIQEISPDMVYLYSRYNRDESKNWVRVWYEYQRIQTIDSKATLALVGSFSPELVETKFDFFRGERVQFFGVINNPHDMAAIMRGCNVLLAPYQYDCYSNTIQEAMACGMKIDTMGEASGGTPELLEKGVMNIESMANYYYQTFLELK